MPDPKELGSSARPSRPSRSPRYGHGRSRTVTVTVMPESASQRLPTRLPTIQMLGRRRGTDGPLGTTPAVSMHIQVHMQRCRARIRIRLHRTPGCDRRPQRLPVNNCPSQDPACPRSASTAWSYITRPRHKIQRVQTSWSLELHRGSASTGRASEIPDPRTRQQSRGATAPENAAHAG